MPSPIPPTEKACLHCEETYISTDARQKFCSGRCRRRNSAEQMRGECVDCGTTLSIGSEYHGTKRCAPCAFRVIRESHEDRDRQIEAWWNEGVSTREIGERLGWTANHVGVEINRLRRRGYRIPYRNQGYDRFPDQVAA